MSWKRRSPDDWQPKDRLDHARWLVDLEHRRRDAIAARVAPGLVAYGLILTALATNLDSLRDTVIAHRHLWGIAPLLAVSVVYGFSQGLRLLGLHRAVNARLPKKNSLRGSAEPEIRRLLKLHRDLAFENLVKSEKMFVWLAVLITCIIVTVYLFTMTAIHR